MHIQFDREDPESVAGFTFDNTELDQEQLTDFLFWLQTKDLTYSKLKLRTGQSNEKVTCIIVNNLEKTINTPLLPPVPINTSQVLVNTPPPVKAPVILSLQLPKSEAVQELEKDDSDTESESDSETINKTKKTTKKVVKK
jgi:hypothetical protein